MSLTVRGIKNKLTMTDELFVYLFFIKMTLKESGIEIKIQKKCFIQFYPAEGDTRHLMRRDSSLNSHTFISPSSQYLNGGPCMIKKHTI